MKKLIIIVLTLLLVACSRNDSESNLSISSNSQEAEIYSSENSMSTSDLSAVTDSSCLIQPEMKLDFFPINKENIDFNAYTVTQYDNDDIYGRMKFFSLYNGEKSKYFYQAINLYSELAKLSDLGYKYARGKIDITLEMVNLTDLYFAKFYEKSYEERLKWLESLPIASSTGGAIFVTEEDYQKCLNKFLCDDYENITIKNEKLYIPQEKIYLHYIYDKHDFILPAILEYAETETGVTIVLSPLLTYDANDFVGISIYDSATNNNNFTIGKKEYLYLPYEKYDNVAFEIPALNEEFNDATKVKMSFCKTDIGLKIHRIDYIK